MNTTGKREREGRKRGRGRGKEGKGKHIQMTIINFHFEIAKYFNKMIFINVKVC